MPKTILTFLRHEIVVIAGIATAVLSFVVTNENVIAAIIPLVVSLLTRTQVSPVSKLEELVKLIGELRSRPTPVATPVAVIPVKPRPPEAS